MVGAGAGESACCCLGKGLCVGWWREVGVGRKWLVLGRKDSKKATGQVTEVLLDVVSKCAWDGAP